MIDLAKLLKSATFETGSVSQAKAINLPFEWSAESATSTTPSLVALSARLAATFCPALRSTSIAASKSPSASVRAFLQSIIPAPVIWRNLLTSAAVIDIV